MSHLLAWAAGFLVGWGVGRALLSHWIKRELEEMRERDGKLRRSRT